MIEIKADETSQTFPLSKQIGECHSQAAPAFGMAAWKEFFLLTWYSGIILATLGWVAVLHPSVIYHQECACTGI